MWPFRRKSKELPPSPKPVPLLPGSAAGARINEALSGSPDLINWIAQQQPSVVVVHLDHVGAATASVSMEAGEHTTVRLEWHTWIPFDRYHKQRPRNKNPLNPVH